VSCIPWHREAKHFRTLIPRERVNMYSVQLPQNQFNKHINVKNTLSYFYKLLKLAYVCCTEVSFTVRNMRYNVNFLSLIPAVHVDCGTWTSDLHPLVDTAVCTVPRIPDPDVNKQQHMGCIWWSLWSEHKIMSPCCGAPWCKKTVKLRKMRKSREVISSLIRRRYISIGKMSYITVSRHN